MALLWDSFIKFALDEVEQVIYFNRVETGILYDKNLNNFFESLKNACDNPDWVGMSLRKIWALKKKNKPFLTNITFFRCISGNLHLDDETINDN